MRNPFSHRTRQAEPTPDSISTTTCGSSLLQAELSRAHRFAVHCENRQPFTAPDITDWQH